MSFFHRYCFGAFLVTKLLKSVTYLQGGLLENIQACHLPVLYSVIYLYPSLQTSDRTITATSTLHTSLAYELSASDL